jgi:hypothetical protein
MSLMRVKKFSDWRENMIKQKEKKKTDNRAERIGSITSNNHTIRNAVPLLVVFLLLPAATAATTAATTATPLSGAPASA